MTGRSPAGSPARGSIRDESWRLCKGTPPTSASACESDHLLGPTATRKASIRGVAKAAWNRRHRPRCDRGPCPERIESHLIAPDRTAFEKKRPGRRESPGPNDGCYPDYRFLQGPDEGWIGRDRSGHATTPAIKGSLKADDTARLVAAGFALLAKITA